MIVIFFIWAVFMQIIYENLDENFKCNISEKSFRWYKKTKLDFGRSIMKMLIFFI